MSNPSHPHPMKEVGRLCPTPLRELIPLESPESVVSKPPLPSPPRTFLDASYILTTHLVPAASPRSTPDVPLPALPTWTPDKEQWKASVMRTAEEIASTRYKQWDGELASPGSTKPLWVCANRYVRKDVLGAEESRGLTLFAAHANGFPKEIWEPALLKLIEAQQAAQGAYAIDEIWVWEAVNHGDAFLVNAGNLGGMYDWQDNCRDILQFLMYYLPIDVTASALPTHLPCHSEALAHHRKTYGHQTRTLIAIGHSLGGCSITRAAISVPKLFSSIVLVDPIIRPHPREGPLLSGRTYQYVIGALQRQNQWSSREEARKRFNESPFFSVWDPAVLDIYLECGLCDDPNGGVKLKMPGIHEALVFSEVMTPYETWDLVDSLDTSIELKWIVPGKNPPEEAGVREMLVWRRPENASNVIIPFAGHLIVQEAPAALAEEIHSFLQRKYGFPASRL
ncbi:alpha/beta-hydrolase [Laetiporus sulphureus 93-53]|uniref:Alpha/beta-hydrolase n=1 Tax=Laetiporus sulphureus 93-53 TaxID=1314785 RepID=A0A165HDV2_9APHY|nr:alpha/beta-hydrolase [Laetiporus sulphureus 93-53]KZT11604.1 alpha/beta-hydrolase [Laetiporus sulphureus 93-53]